MADVSNGKHKKKEKKAEVPVEVKEAVETEEIAAAAGVAETEKEKKKRKKEKKRAEAEAAAAALVAAEGAEAIANGDESAKKRRKKDEREEKKEEPVEAAAAAPAEDEEARKARKAAKKEKKRREAAEAAAATAAVTEEAKDDESKEVKLVKKSPLAAAAAPAFGSKTFRRCFYTEDRTVTAMTPAEVAALREELEITIHTPSGADVGIGAGRKRSEEEEKDLALRARNAPAFVDIRPLRTFAQSGLPASMLKCTSTFARPTAIQSQIWPAILSGRDVIGIAETGSGKTLGFILPALIHILDQPAIGPGAKAGPICLVLSPTRELAMQTAAVAESSGNPCGVRSTCIYGGVDKNIQKKALKAGVHIVVATPGRLLGLIEENALTLNRCTYLVLDEADRMLDLGFEPDIRAIVGKIGPERQTLLFSATWPTAIQALGREFVQNPFHVTIGKAQGELAANHRVKQIIEVLDERAKDRRLLQLLSEYHSSRKNRVLIFVLYKKEVDRVERWLTQNGWKAAGISGDKNQHDRTQALAQFKDGSRPLLIATDVAARGLDIPSVEYVINYSFPLTIEDYVHRIGRTGRGGKTGTSHTFFCANEKGLAGELAGVLKEAGEPVPEALLAFGLTTKKKEHALYGNHFRKDSDMKAMAPQRRVKFD